MPLMNWDATLDVGVAKMNDEHKDILSLMNELYDAQQAGQTGAHINTLVKKLGDVTTSHFKDEEAYMDSIDYEGRHSHKLIHKDLLEKYTMHAKAISADGGKLNDKFFTFLKLWLTAHIKGIDMKYSPNAQLKKAG